MKNAIIYQKAEKEIYYIDGILSILQAVHMKLLFAVFLYILVFVFENFLKKQINFKNDQSKLFEQYDEIKLIHYKFNKIIPLISTINNPFFPGSLSKRFCRYEEYLENLLDGLAISTDKEAKRSVEKLPDLLKDASKKLPTMDEILKDL